MKPTEPIPAHINSLGALVLWLADKHHAGDLRKVAERSGVPLAELMEWVAAAEDDA